MFLGSNIHIGNVSNLALSHLQRLIAEGIHVGSAALPVTSSWTGDANWGILFDEDGMEREINAGDPLITYDLDGLPIVHSYAGGTLLADNDFTSANWAKTNLTVTEPESNVYRVTVNNPGSDATLDFDLTAGANDRIWDIQLKLVSGTGVVGDYMQFVDTATQRGTAFTFDNITSSFTSAEASVLSGDGSTNRMRFNFGASSVITFDIKYSVAEDSTVKTPPYPHNSSAGATRGNVINSCTPSWTAQGTIMGRYTPYGWCQNAHPVSDFARLFSASNVMEAWVKDVTLVGSGAVPLVPTGGHFIDDTSSTFSGDWDGIDIGARFSTIARQTASESDILSGTLYPLNRSDGERSFHGQGQFSLYNRVLPDADYNVLQDKWDEYPGLTIYVQETGGNVEFSWDGIIGESGAPSGTLAGSADQIVPSTGNLQTADRTRSDVPDDGSNWSPGESYSGTTNAYGNGAAFTDFLITSNIPMVVRSDGTIRVGHITDGGGVFPDLATQVFTGSFSLPGTFADYGLFTSGYELPVTLWTSATGCGKIVLRAV